MKNLEELKAINNELEKKGVYAYHLELAAICETQEQFDTIQAIYLKLDGVSLAQLQDAIVDAQSQGLELKDINHKNIINFIIKGVKKLWTKK